MEIDGLTPKELKLRLERIFLEMEYKTDWMIELVKQYKERNDLIRRILEEGSL